MFVVKNSQIIEVARLAALMLRFAAICITSPCPLDLFSNR